MDPTTATSTITTQGPPHASGTSTPPLSEASIPAQVLEISLISAQDLTPLYKSMRTYAVAWISANPNEKFTTRTDQHHTSPTWNDKFTFNVDIQALFAAEAALHVEIYTVSWFRHVLVGTVKVLVTDLLSPAIRMQHNTRFVALQVRRPSGTPQGILNMGVTFHDHSLRAMLRQHDHDNFSELDRKSQNPFQANDDDDGEFGKKIQQWRRSSSESEINHHDFPLNAGSVCNGSMVNGSMVNGSELCSDIGPSASIVAADLAMKLQPPHPHPHPHPPLVVRRPVINYGRADDSESSILGELTMAQVVAKGYRSRTRTTGDRWRRVVYEEGDQSELSTVSSQHSRRNSDGGLFSCLVYGIEFRVACGAGANSGSGKHGNAPVRRKELN